MFAVDEIPPISDANEGQEQRQQRLIQVMAGNSRRGRFTTETPLERELTVLKFSASNEGEGDNKKPRSRGSNAWPSKDKAVSRRQRSRETGDWNIRGNIDKAGEN